MKLDNYPIRKKVDVHTAVGAGLWKEIERIAKKNDLPKVAVINALLALGIAAGKRAK